MNWIEVSAKLDNFSSYVKLDNFWACLGWTKSPQFEKLSKDFNLLQPPNYDFGQNIFLTFDMTNVQNVW